MQQRFLLQILLLAQHVSGTTMHIIRSSGVLYIGCCLWYLVLCPKHVEQAIRSAIKNLCCIYLAFYFHLLQCSREPDPGPYAEPHKLLHILTSCLFRHHFNIILLSEHTSSKLSFFCTLLE